MGRNDDPNAYLTMMVGVILVIGAIGAGVFLINRSIENAVAEDTQITYISYDDITDLEDETDTNPEVPDDPPEDDVPPLDDEDEDTTVVYDPTEADDEVVDVDDDPETAPRTYDHSLAGSIAVKAELIGVSGTPLSFVKQFGGEEIEKLKITYVFDFDLGEDLAPETFQLNVKGISKRVYYRDLMDTWISGSVSGSKFFDATIYGSEGMYDIMSSDVQTLDIEDGRLGFWEVKDYGSGNMIVYTTTDSLVLEWEAIVETTGGIAKKVTGSTGVAVSMYWDRDAPTYTVPDAEGDEVVDWYNLVAPYEFDPYSQAPLMSIVQVG